MADKKLFKLIITLPSGNMYVSDDIFKIEPEKMAHNIMSFKTKFKDMKVKFKCVVVDEGKDPAYLIEGDLEVKKGMSLAIAAALQLESKIEYGEELISE